MGDNKPHDAPDLDQEIANLPPKERLEALKLRTEIRQMERSRSRDPVFWRDLIGIVAVVGTILYSASDFIGQQKARNRFEVTREMITLVEQVRDPSDETRRSAAILLTAWGDKALDLLLKSVESERDLESSGLSYALELIGRDDPGTVLKPLRKRTSELAARLRDDGGEQTVRALLNHIDLLGNLAGLRDTQSSVEELRRIRGELGCPPEQATGDLAISTENLDLVCRHIDDSLAKLDG